MDKKIKKTKNNDLEKENNEKTRAVEYVDVSKNKNNKKTNWIKWGVIINFIMLIAIIISMLNITIPLPSFEKVEYKMYTLEKPISSEILPHLKTSPLYYVELIVDGLPQNLQSVNYDDDLKFSVKTVNKGKKPVKEPFLMIFIVDSIGNIRGAYPSQMINWLDNNSTNILPINDDIKGEENMRDINLKFKMPSKDQKVMGNWKVFVYLFDKNSEEFVSYAVYNFVVEDQNEMDNNRILLSLIASMMAAVAALMLWKNLKKKNN